jgi:hypothetical protein
MSRISGKQYTSRNEPELVEAKLQLLRLRVRSGGGEGLSLQGRGTDERDGVSGGRNDDGSGAATAADERGRERYLRDGGEKPRPDRCRCWSPRRTERRRRSSCARRHLSRPLVAALGPSRITTTVLSLLPTLHSIGIGPDRMQ